MKRHFNLAMAVCLTNFLLVARYLGWRSAKWLDNESGLHLPDRGQGISGKWPFIHRGCCLLQLVKRCNANFGCW
jgi:hypothetical protein